MDLKISFLSMIRVIFFRRCFFTQILNSLYQGGQIFHIRDRFYNYLGYGSSIYFISILIEFLYFTVFVSGLLAGNAIPVDLILMGWNSMFPLESLSSFLLVSYLPSDLWFRSFCFSFVFFWWSYITTPFLFCQYFFAIFFIISVLFFCSHFNSVICINYFDYSEYFIKIPSVKKAGTLHFYSSLPFSLFIFCCNWSGSLSGWSLSHHLSARPGTRWTVPVRFPLPHSR